MFKPSPPTFCADWESGLGCLTSPNRGPTRRLFRSDQPDQAPLVIAAVQTPSYRQQLEFGMRGHEAFGRVEYVDRMATVAGHRGHTDSCPSIQLLRTGLGGRHTELALQLRDDG